jgi:hypothetical protein
MIFVLCVMTVFAFLVLGSLAFMVCVLMPPTRRYALSTALWFAAWGPCLAVLIVLVVLGVAGAALTMKAGSIGIDWTAVPGLMGALGWGYLTLGVLVTAVVASGAAWLHQKLVHRFTFALFRIYATAVSAGIGSVYGWCLGWWIEARGTVRFGVWWWGVAMLFLITGFGAAAYKGARSLRGKAPTRFTWISEDEFAGSD